MPASSSPYVTLISSDGFEFIVTREAACVAGTIKKMLDPHSTRPHFFNPSPAPRASARKLSFTENGCTDEMYNHRFFRRVNFRPMYPWHDQVRLLFHTAPLPLL